MFGKTKKRLDALEDAVAAMRLELRTLHSSHDRESEAHASLSKTLNEWVWGEEKHESNGIA